MKKTSYCQKTLLVGAGRLAKHLQYFCKTRNWQIHQTLPAKTSSLKPQLILWNRSKSKGAFQNSLNECDQVWLAITDSALEDFIRKNLSNYSGKIVHFSGALNIPGTFSAHPLMTFSQKLYPKLFYPQIIWILSQPMNWAWHFPHFPNTHRRISSQEKTLYHLFCVMSGNFTQILLNSLSDQFKGLGLHAEDLSLYWMQSFLNQQTLGWKGVTGPLPRHDHKTMAMHLKTLSSNKTTALSAAQRKIYKKLYQNFQSLYALEGKSK